MGLDTTHDCWHGPYSQFTRWRAHLHMQIQIERTSNSPNLGLDDYWDLATKGETRPWPYTNESDPLDFLMSHSDCDGEIPVAMCGPLADALAGLLDRMPRRGLYDVARPATERFVAGLRRAAVAGEPVEFR
jgi:hypothetical protein